MLKKLQIFLDKNNISVKDILYKIFFPSIGKGIALFGLSYIAIPFIERIVIAVLKKYEITIEPSNSPYLGLALIVIGLGYELIKYWIENNSKKEVLKTVESKVMRSKKQDNILELSIKRDIEDKVLTAIKSNEQIIIIKGEEGIGKTILGLQLKERLENDYIVHFLESNKWQNFQSISKVIFQEDIETFKQSILKEPKDIIVFLDGVNEKNALDSSIQILESYDNQNEDVKKKITLVFTTRDLSLYPEYIALEWKNYETFELKKFKEDELKKAIKKLDPSFDYSNFPKKLKSIASIPRYLSLAFKLKSKFSNYENITKEMLYFEGLKEQIGKDLKIRKLKIANEKNLESILYRLSEVIKIDRQGIASINQKEFKEVFGEDFEKIETPFQENRIVTDININEVEINFNIVVIAYSVYLINFFKEIDITLSVAEIADFFKEKLEPYDNDKMTIVPFIVFQLALEKEHNLEKDELAKIYAGLLYLWLDNHNSDIDRENYKYWANSNLPSFCSILDIVEFRHKRFDRDRLEELLLDILCERWRESKGEDIELQNYIESLFLQDFSADDVKENRYYVERGCKILFVNPTEYFLDIFTQMYANLASSNVEKKDFFLYRYLNKYLSILFRFGYKEDIFELLEKKKEYNLLIDFYKSYNLSGKYNRTINKNNHSYLDSIDKVSNKEEIFNTIDISRVSPFYIPYLHHIASRIDLELNQIDKDRIENLVSNSNFFNEEILSCIDCNKDTYESIPILLSSFNPKLFNSVNQNMLFKSIEQKVYRYDIDKFNIAILPSEKISKYIIENLDDLLVIEDKNKRDVFIGDLIQIMLFTATQDELLILFDKLIEKPPSTLLERKCICPLNNSIKYELLELIYQKINSYIEEKKDNKQQYNSYMNYLYILDDLDNKHLQDWTKNILKNKNASGGAEDYFKNIVINSSPSKFYNEEFKDILYQKNSSINGVFISHWITKEEGFYSEKSLDELIEILPMDSVGILLHHNERFEELIQWAIYLFENLEPKNIVDYNVLEPMRYFAEHNQEEFKKYAVKHLTIVNGDFSDGGRHFFSSRRFEKILIDLLIPYDLYNAMKFYGMTNEDRNFDNSFIKKLLQSEQYKKFHRDIIETAENDLEYLQVVVLSYQNGRESHLLELCKELEHSQYSVDRLKAISLLIWIATDETIAILEELKIDDSEYVRAYARWAKEVSLQEKYCRKIYEEVLQEDDLEIISAKLHQIYYSLSPTICYWLSELNKKYDYNSYSFSQKTNMISRFLTLVQRRMKDDKRVEILSHKLIEYYCGEEIDADFKYITGIS